VPLVRYQAVSSYASIVTKYCERFCILRHPVPYDTMCPTVQIPTRRHARYTPKRITAPPTIYLKPNLSAEKTIPEARPTPVVRYW
jgi:hypothetical protein